MTITDATIIDEYRARPFDMIECRLEATRAHLDSAPLDVLATAIRLSTINSILSLNTHVHAHERGTIAVWQALEDGVTALDELSEAAHQSTPSGRNHVMYYNQKAEWIQTNLIDVDYTELGRLLRSDGIKACQQALVRQVEGLGNRKAAFSLANLGYTDAVCIDSVMERAFEVRSGTTEGRWSAINPFDTAVTDRYYDRVETLQAETPEASAQLEPYIWQWAAWSAERTDGFNMHDGWFLLLDTLLDADIFTPRITQCH